MAEKESIEILADRVEKIACANCKHHLDISSLPLFTLFNCPECHAQQMVPGKLGNFLLLEELGRGGMGVVYRGQDMALGRPVAIKVMHKSLGDDPQFLETFLREARAAAAINHKNVVQIFSFGREKGQPYLVMELVDGGRLDAYIASSQPLTEIQAVDVCLDVSEGLKAAHDAGLMHGDIKPANILFDQNGMAKVADFGLAGFIQQQKAGSRDIWGTPFYIAPEKARRQKVDQRADIYSLGATMFHAMTIRPPFDGDTPTHVVLARLQLPPPDISAVRTDLHPEIIRIINRMLAVDPGLRYPTYASLISDLLEAKAKLAGTTGSKTDAGGTGTKARGSKWGIYLVVGGVLLALAAAAIFLFSSRSKQTAPPTPAPEVVSQPASPPPAAAPVTTNTNVVNDPVNPFNAEEDHLIAEAVKPLVLGDSTKVIDRLQLLRLNVCTNQAQQYWLQLFQALTYQFDGRQSEFEKILKALPAPPPPTTDVKDEATRIPLISAQFLLKKVEKNELSNINAQAPAWCKTFVDFIEGWRIWTTGLMRGGAHEKFRAYRPATPNEPGWPFAFRPLTDSWLKQVELFNKIQPRLNTLTRNRKFPEARKLLRDFTTKCIPIQYNVTESFLRNLDRKEKEVGQNRTTGGQSASDELANDMTDGSTAVKPTPPPKPATPAQPKPTATPPRPTTPPKPEPVVQPPPPLKAAFASSETKTEPARLAIDGNFHTRWASHLRDNQWLAVDLGNNRKVTGVVLHWDAAYAIDYKIQVSRDRAFWTDVLKVANSGGGREVKLFNNKPVEGRYVRIYCLIRNYKLPYVALFEVQVLVDGQKPPPPPSS